MLAAKFSKTAASWLGASVKAPKTSVARKVNLKSTFVKKTKKISIPVFTKIEVRSVITLAEGVAVEENDVTHVADLRGLDQSVEFITGVPQSQLHRRVIIYRPTPKTTQSGTKVRCCAHFLVSNLGNNAHTRLEIDLKATLTLIASFFHQSEHQRLHEIRSPRKQSQREPDGMDRHYGPYWKPHSVFL